MYLQREVPLRDLLLERREADTCVVVSDEDVGLVELLVIAVTDWEEHQHGPSLALLEVAFDVVAEVGDVFDRNRKVEVLKPALAVQFARGRCWEDKPITVRLNINLSFVVQDELKM